MRSNYHILIDFIKEYINGNKTNLILNKWISYNFDKKTITIWAESDLDDGELLMFKMFSKNLTIFVTQEIIDEIQSQSDRLYKL